MSENHPEYRRDPVTGRWVIVAPERSARPMALSHSKPHFRRDAERDVCPFCPGQEATTPDEVYAVRNGLQWKLRVVPNKFPAVRTIENAEFRSSGDLYETFPGFGRHEVVIECAHHESNPARLTDAEFAQVLIAYRERLKALSADPQTAYVTVFKNVGAEAGASIAHTHSQLVATPIVPDSIRRELETASDYHQRTGRCVICDMLERDLADGQRVVARTGNFVALVPFGGRFAYETWIVPRQHESRFETLLDSQSEELAKLLKDVLLRIDAFLGEPAYNYYLHTGPARTNPLPYYHWHLEIYPRTAHAAGFEWGSGCFINAVPAERAARELREVPLLPDEHVFG